MGHKFSTYATWWIQQAVQRAVANQGRTIRLPVHVSDSLTHARATIRQFADRNGREPNAYELADLLKLSSKAASQALMYLSEVASLNDERIGEIADTRQYNSDVPVLDDADEQIGDADVTTPESYLDPIDEPSSIDLLLAAADGRCGDLEAMIDSLPQRQADVVRMRFGFDSCSGKGEPMTLQEIGEVFGVTRERIRQIESKALKELRELIESRGYELFAADASIFISIYRGDAEYR